MSQAPFEIQGAPWAVPPEVTARMREIHEAEHRERFAARRSMVRFAAVICSCRTRFNWGADPSPPQGNCLIHGQMVLMENGEWV